MQCSNLITYMLQDDRGRRNQFLLCKLFEYFATAIGLISTGKNGINAFLLREDSEPWLKSSGMLVWVPGRVSEWMEYIVYRAIWNKNISFRSWGVSSVTETALSRTEVWASPSKLQKPGEDGRFEKNIQHSVLLHNLLFCLKFRKHYFTSPFFSFSIFYVEIHCLFNHPSFCGRMLYLQG